MSSANEKDYFSSFLSAASDGPAPPPLDPNNPAADVEKKMLLFLATQTKPVSVRELLSNLAIPPSSVIMAIHHLSDAKLVNFAQGVEDESVSLTDLGRRVAA